MSQRESQEGAGLQQRLWALVESNRFQAVVVAVIVANAATLGLQTFPRVEREYGDLLSTLDDVFLAFFCVEIVLRVAAFGARPDRFFRNGWNVFDFVVVAAAFAPGLRENATLLRLVRLLRVVRIITVMPDLRILIRGMVASLKPIASMAVLAGLLMYVYGIVGWILFHEEDPGRWGTVGEAMLTLFIVMTLESWPDIMGVAREIHPASWIFFVSYVLIASFLLINILIAILINAIEEARSIHRRQEAREKAEKDRAEIEAGAKAAHEGISSERAVALEERAAKLREALEDLEAEIGSSPSPRRATVGMASKGRLKP